MRAHARVAVARVLVGILAPLVALSGGCAALLGLEETTLRDADADAALPDGSLPDGAFPDGAGDAGVSALSVEPRSVLLRLGGEVTVTVSVMRTGAPSGDLEGAVTAQLVDLPSGVAARPVTIPANASSAVVTLTAAPNAVLGSREVKVEADRPGVPPAELSLLVADAPGKLDVTFDADGVAVEGATGNGSIFHALAVQPDGAIVAGGAAGGLGVPGSGWLLRRFAPGGGPDPAFAAQTASLPTNGALHAVAIDPGGRIVCAGSSSPVEGAPLELTVARLHADGSLDPSFAGGIVRLAEVEAPAGSTALALALSPDGKVVVAGARGELLDKDTGIVTRFTGNGLRDGAFNGGQLVVVPEHRFVGVTIDANGGIVIGGTDLSATSTYSIHRRTATGAPDPSFGGAGGLRFGAGYHANAFTMLPNGRFALVGEAPATPGTYTAGVASAEGQQVWVRAIAFGAAAGFFGVAAQADGRLVAAGHTAGAGGEARVDRFASSDGTRDATFGDAGTAALEPAGNGNAFDVTLFAAAVQPDGRILAAGNRTDSGAVVYRLWP
jgi:uncharacterized delta-60 repeat protein